MPKYLPRRLRVLAVAGASGFGIWNFLPTSPGLQTADAAGFRMAIRSFANPPFFVSGAGTQDDPWGVRLLESRESGDTRYLPKVVRVPDDPDGVFQSSPPSPVDYAVIFRNLHRLGTRHLAVGAVMAWEDPDPIARTALDSRMDLFDSLVTVSPLARGTTAEPIPAAFVRASLPLEKVVGDTQALPLVNRLPLPGTVLGDQRSFAGFSDLESEPKGKVEPLLARWGDRIVLAFPLVAVLAERGLPVDGVEVHLGSVIKLGPEGPIVPIDERGCLRVGEFSPPVSPDTIMTILEAETLENSESVLLRDDRQAARIGQRDFSSRVEAMIAAIRSEAGLSTPAMFRRLDVRAEGAVLASLVALLTVASGRSNFGVRLFFLIAVGGVLVAQICGVVWAKVWLPGLPAMGAVLAGGIVAWPFGRVSQHSLGRQETVEEADVSEGEQKKEEEQSAAIHASTVSPTPSTHSGIPSTRSVGKEAKAGRKSATKGAKKVSRKRRGPSSDSDSSRS